MSGPVYSGGDSSNPASVWYRAGIDRLNRGVRNRSRDPPSKTRSRSSGERPSGGWDRSCFGVDYSPPTLGEGPSRPPVRQLLAPSEGSEQKGRFGWKRSSSQPERTVRAKHNLRNPEPIASLSLARRQSSVDDNHFAPIYSGGLDPPVRKLSSDFNSKRLSIQPHQLQGDRNPSGPISPIQQFYRDNYPPRTTSQSGSSEPHSEHRQLAQSTSEPIYTAPTTYNPPPSAFVAQPNNLQRHLLQPLPANGTPPKPISTVSLDSIDHAAARAFKRNAGGGASMMEQERGRTRRERTFVGSVCSVCDEPLEHTLRGERILQFSCGHVSHEACFYEYIREFESQFCPVCNAPLGLDTSRGGNVLDIGRIGHHHQSFNLLKPVTDVAFRKTK